MSVVVVVVVVANVAVVVAVVVANVVVANAGVANVGVANVVVVSNVAVADVVAEAQTTTTHPITGLFWLKSGSRIMNFDEHSHYEHGDNSVVVWREPLIGVTSATRAAVAAAT